RGGIRDVDVVPGRPAGARMQCFGPSSARPDLGLSAGRTGPAWDLPRLLLGTPARLGRQVTRADVQPQPAVMPLDVNLVARLQLAGEQHPGQPAVEVRPDGPPQRASPELGLVASAGQPSDSVPADVHSDVLAVQAVADLLKLELGDGLQL